MTDARYFYATGFSPNASGDLYLPKWWSFPMQGEYAGAEFGNLQDAGGGLLQVVIGTTTLTAPDGVQKAIVAAFDSSGVFQYNLGNWNWQKLNLSLFLLDDGTLVALQRDAATKPNLFADQFPVSFQARASALTLTDTAVITFPPGQYDGSFGGAAGMTCFTAGTLVATVAGPRPVETIRPGDLVLTRDRGYRPVRWAGQQRLSALRLAAAERLRPVRIAAGALGPGMPARDLLVSPQHRMLLAGPEVAHRFGTTEVLVAAKHLVGLPGIGIDLPAGGVTYVHLLFDAHEILLADGAWSESLYTGPWAMKMLPAAQRAEILTLFPDLAQGATAHATPARRFLTGREAQDLRLGPATAPGAQGRAQDRGIAANLAGDAA